MSDICPFHSGQFFMSLYHILFIGPLLKLPVKKKKKKEGSEIKKKKIDHPTMRCQLNLPEWLKLKRLTISSVDKYMAPQKPS